MNNLPRWFMVMMLILAVVGLLWWARGADPEDPSVFTRFYMRVWKLFFLEYVLVALACLAG